MTLRTETMVSNSQKRKAVNVLESELKVKSNKNFKEASEFFDLVSSGATEPAEDVIVDREVIKSKSNTVIKQEIEELDNQSETAVNSAYNLTETSAQPSIEQATVKSKIPETDLETVEVLDNMLIDNLLMSDDEDDLEETEENIIDNKILSGLLQDKTKKTIDNIQSLIYDSLRKKNKEIEVLKTKNVTILDDFTSKIQVKKEILDDNMEKNKSEFDEKIRNIDEEQNYLIEEIKIKEEAMKELTGKYEISEKLVAELQKALNKKEHNLVRFEEKIVRLEGRISMMSKRRPPKSEVENKLASAEEEMEKMRDGRAKLEKLLEGKDDDVSKLEEQKYFLENSLLEKQLEVKKKEEQKVYMEKELSEQKIHFEKELREMHEGMKTFKLELKDGDKLVKARTLKIKHLESIISQKDHALKEEKVSKEKRTFKIRQLEEAAKLTEEYKLDLESRICETEKTIKDLQEENDTIITEDIKVIEKGREDISEMKSRMNLLRGEIKSLADEKVQLRNNLSGKEQEKISLQIIASEKDEILLEKNKNIEKLKKKNENLKTKIIYIAEMKEGLDNRITITEIKYFNLEKELGLKQAEIKRNVDEHQKELEEFNLEKKKMIEESEKHRASMDEKMKKTKTFLMEQINLIKKKSGQKINLSTDPIVV